MGALGCFLKLRKLSFVDQRIERRECANDGKEVLSR